MTGVKCMCEECHYNKNYKCNASNIEVKSSGDNKVHSSEGTRCNTFEAEKDSFTSRA